MASKIKYDRLSKEFIEIFNELTSNEGGEDFILKYINEYVRLIDAYLSYNERYLFEEYINCCDEKYSFSIKGKINHRKTFGELIKGHPEEAKLEILVNIRNMIVHNFWIYSEPNTHWETSEDYIQAVKYFILKTLPKNFKGILPLEIKVNDFPSQKKKFEDDIKNKAEYIEYLL